MAGVSAGAVMGVSLVGVVLSPVKGVEWDGPSASGEDAAWNRRPPWEESAFWHEPEAM